MNAHEIRDALAAAFREDEVEWKAQTVSGSRALAVAYVDARCVQQRLDDVLGIDGWQDDYEVYPDGAVACRLSLRLGGEWLIRMDVGSESEQKEAGDRRKAAFSDALKRAAVKWGVGRYLYAVEPTWVDFDPVKKRLLAFPPPPVGPLKMRPPAPAPAAAPPGREAEPRTGAGLAGWLRRLDAAMVAKGWCAEGDVLKEIIHKMGSHWPGAVDSWPPDPVPRAVVVAREFKDACRARASALAAGAPAALVGAPAPAEDEGRGITAVELNALEQLLGQKGRTENDAKRPLGLGPKDLLGDINLRQYREAMAGLAVMPDKPPARKRA